MLVYSPEKIVTLRTRLGLNQSELARKAGLSAPSVWALEKGETRMPKFKTLYDISQALGVSLQEIMADKQPSDINNRIAAAAAALTPANKGCAPSRSTGPPRVAKVAGTPNSFASVTIYFRCTY